MKRFFILILLIPLGWPGILRALEYRVGTWKTAQTIQPFFYEKYLPEGDHLALFTFTNPADQKTALLAGSLDICGTTLAHAIQSASMGQPVVMVAALCNKASALVVKKDRSVMTVTDLKGKRIGYVPGTMHEILLRETLTRNGLSPEKDVTLIRVDFFDMCLALARGGIDAFLSGEPFPSLAVDQGLGRILTHPYYDQSVGTINAGMLVTREMIEKDPMRVAALVKAHVLSTRYLTENQSAWLSKAVEFGTALPILEKAAPNMELSWDMDADFIRKVKALGERMQSLGLIKKQPDYAALIDPSFVQAVKRNLEVK
ncbi:MAG: ABC transporter substrate-binding protein [Deltaproteobacteria bacterium]|nr:ABC transporter substrate-binding protein [Deltaproteobacteria bacterium]